MTGEPQLFPNHPTTATRVVLIVVGLVIAVSLTAVAVRGCISWTFVQIFGDEFGIGPGVGEEYVYLGGDYQHGGVYAWKSYDAIRLHTPPDNVSIVVPAKVIDAQSNRRFIVAAREQGRAIDYWIIDIRLGAVPGAAEF